MSFISKLHSLCGMVWCRTLRVNFLYNRRGGGGGGGGLDCECWHDIQYIEHSFGSLVVGCPMRDWQTGDRFPLHWTVDLEMVLQGLPYQAPSIMGSVLELVGLLSVYCNWMRWQV